MSIIETTHVQWASFRLSHSADACEFNINEPTTYTEVQAPLSLRSQRLPRSCGSTFTNSRFTVTLAKMTTNENQSYIIKWLLPACILLHPPPCPASPLLSICPSAPGLPGLAGSCSGVYWRLLSHHSFTRVITIRYYKPHLHISPLTEMSTPQGKASCLVPLPTSAGASVLKASLEPSACPKGHSPPDTRPPSPLCVLGVWQVSREPAQGLKTHPLDLGFPGPCASPKPWKPGQSQVRCAPGIIKDAQDVKDLVPKYM